MKASGVRFLIPRMWGLNWSRSKLSLRRSLTLAGMSVSVEDELADGVLKEKLALYGASGVGLMSGCSVAEKWRGWRLRQNLC